MVPSEISSAECIDEDAALDFAQGLLSLTVVERIDAHADSCSVCRVLLDEAVRAFRERSTMTGAEAPAHVTRLAPGDTLAGRYQIVRFIARGGMGEVYEAEDLMLGTRIAVKTLAATISDDPQAIRRLKLEVNVARRITHPNVCRIFDLGVHAKPGSRAGEGVYFITMELVPGTSLGRRLRTEGRLPPAEALPVAKAMVAAIGAAHRAGVVHRDFKSDNVMLAPEPGGGPPRAVVMDFGLARASSIPSASTSVDSRSLTGTLAYMAPEQLQGKPVQPATDIYALGIVMFEMLTGQLPFQGQSPLEAAWKRVSEPPPRLGSLLADLDPRWEVAVSRCLEPDAAARPASADEVAALLDGDGPASARGLAIPPPPDPQPAAPQPAAPRPAAVTSRGRRIIAAAAGTVMGFATAWVAVGAFERAAQPPAARAESAPALGVAPAAALAPAAAPASEPPRAAVPEGRPAPPPPATAPATAEIQTVAPAATATAPAADPVVAPARAGAGRHPAPPVSRRRSVAAPARPPEPEVKEPGGASPSQPAGAPDHRRSTDPDDGFIFR